MKKELLGDQGKSFGNLITDAKFIVPRYQRGYKWDKDNWEKFYNSVIKLNGKLFDDIHYLGNIIVKKDKTFDNYINYEIVDGHQRLATLFIFFASMIKVMDDLIREGKIENKEIKRYEDQKEDIIKLIFIDPDLDEEDCSKNNLKFEPHNRQERKDFIKLFSSKIHEHSFTCVLLKKAFDFFSKKLKNESSMSGLVEAKTIFKTLNERFRFTVIDLPEQTTSEEVLGIFEIINDTGQRLEPADKLKSLLFEKSVDSKKSKEEKEKIQEDVDKLWEEMEKKLGNNLTKINSFLYNFFASIFERDKNLKKKEFYEFAKKQFESEKAPIDVIELLSKLDNCSSFYKAVIDPVNFAPKNNFEKELKSLLIDIKRLGYSQLHQLILALHLDSHLEPNKKNKILDLLTKCMFRRITVKDLKASKEFEKKIQHWVDFVQKGKGEKILEDDYLRNEFESREEKEEFYNKLRGRTLAKDKNRYIFGKYYLKLNPNIFQYNGKEETEHLVPQNIIKKKNHPWKTIDEWKINEKELVKLVNSIGNLTIIEDASNREAKDKLWSKKIKNSDYINNICLRFEESNKKILIDEKLKSGGELYPQDIENRANKLVEEMRRLEVFEFYF